MNNTGFRVDGGTANIKYFGSLTSDIANNGGVPSPIIDINSTTGGEINLASIGVPSGSVVPNEILDIGGEGIRIESNSATTTINIGSATLVDSVQTGILVLNDESITKIETVPNTTAGPAFTSGIVKTTDGAAIAISGGSPNFTYFGTIENTRPAGIGLAYLTQISNVDDAIISITGPGNTPLNDNGDGVFINGVEGTTTVDMIGLNLFGDGDTGILVQNSTDTPVFTFANTLIGGASGPVSQGILISNNAIGVQTAFSNLDISLQGANAEGIRAVNAGVVTATGANTLFTNSTTDSAIFAQGDAANRTNFENTAGDVLEFVRLESNNPNNTGAGISALTLESGSAGEINITGQFVVGGNDGTVNNITDTGDVDVRVSGTIINP